jgi:F0F1-type ATP synthase delta subunit
MESSYAQALWKVIAGGMTPKKAVDSLHESLAARGRTALMPRIARAFARIAEREEGKSGVTLSVAREKDERKAKSAAKEALENLGVKPADVSVAVDDSLIGGWRLEGRETLVDASFKKQLLDLYARATN